MNTAKDLYTVAREWYEKNEARPISETVRVLDKSRKKAHDLMNVVYDVERLTRQIRDERYISAGDVDQIQEAIAEARFAMFELSEMLNDSMATLKHPEILEEAK
jgi:hypothetical protein